MGEIDTKPIEPVQVALSLFGDKGDQLKHRSSCSSSDVEKEKDIEGLERELANYRLQVETKDSEHKQFLLQLEHYKKTTEQLSVLLKNSELERDRYIEECNEVKNRLDEIESKMKGMVDQLSETAKIREQLSNVLNELTVAQADLLNMENELAAAKDSELKAMTQAELMEASANMEKEKSEELLGRISELQDAVLISKIAAAAAAEKEKCRIVADKDAEMEDHLRKQLETIEELENQLITKSACIDSLQAKLDGIDSVDNATSDDLEFKERKISDQAFYIEALEMELKRFKLELEKNANEVRERENDAQVEIATLKAELHKGRSQIAAAEAGEARAQSVKSGLYLAVQQLSVEAEEVKKENQVLKQGVEDEECDHITISIEEYKSLIRRAEEESKQLAPESEFENEVDVLKKELEAAMVKIGLFRNRAEQAGTRAEAAEKAKATLEDQIRQWQEQKQRRKAALAALREESAPKRFNPPTFEKLPTKYQPLGKVLNMKF